MKDFFCKHYGFIDTPETVKVLMDTKDAPESAQKMHFFFEDFLGVTGLPSRAVFWWVFLGQRFTWGARERPWLIVQKITQSFSKRDWGEKSQDD